MAKILVDLDSTLVDSTTPRLVRTNKKFGTNYKVSDIVSWHNTGYFSPEHDTWMWGPNGFLDPKLHEECKPIKDALRGIEALRNQGHDMFIVTDRPSEIHEATERWVKKHKINLPVYFTYHPESYSKTGTKTKKDFVDEIGIEVVIEDSPHHSTGLAEMPTVETVYLLDYAYNRDVSGPKIVRVQDWQEIINIFSGVYV